MYIFGTIGYIVQGSDMKELFSLIYTSNSLEKMPTLAIRVHTIFYLTLTIIISKELVIDNEMVANLNITVQSKTKEI